MSISDLNNFNLLIIPRLSLLILQISMDFLLISIPVPLNLLLSLRIDKIMHPDPTPISKIFKFVLFFVISKTLWTINSVSGLGINTSLET